MKRDALVTCGFAFLVGFALTLAFCSVCGCTSADRAGHRVEFSVDRMQLEADQAAASATFDGPGPHDATFNGGSGGDLDGWEYGVAYSIPLGDDPAASQIRLLRADVGGMRADFEDFQASVERLTEAVQADIESREMAAYRRQPKPDEPVSEPVSVAAVEVRPTPSVVPEEVSTVAAEPAVTETSDNPDDGLGAEGWSAIGGAAIGGLLIVWKYRALIGGATKALFRRNTDDDS